MRAGKETCQHCKQEYPVVVEDSYNLDEVTFECPHCGRDCRYLYWKIAWVWTEGKLHTKVIGRYDPYAYRFDYYDYLKPSR